MNAKTKKIIIGGIVGIAVVVTVLFMTHVLCIHKWAEATCAEPETCTICDETRGETLEHEIEGWTLITQATCYSVGEQQGTCKVCSEIITEKVQMLEHTEGDWVVTDDYTIHKDATVTPGTESLLCTVCEEELATREYTIELTLAQKNALITALDHIDLFHPSYDYLVEDLLIDISGFDYVDAVFGADYCGADWDEQAVLCATDLVANGFSRSGAAEQLRYYKFSETQINAALEAVGY